MNAGIEQIVRLLQEKGHSLYGGEEVTQLEHALQCATLAYNDAASPAMVTAALLHDIGHLLHHLPDNAPDDGIDDVHEVLADRFLKQYFGEDVCAPVRLHVAAKRYLCATNPVYLGMLSPTSQQSLALQGGPMTIQEAKAFLLDPYFEAAIKQNSRVPLQMSGRCQ